MSGKLSMEQRVEIILLFGRYENYSETAREFNRRHSNVSEITPMTVSRCVKRFKETGSVLDKYRTGRPKSTTDEQTASRVLQKVRQYPRFSVRQVSQDMEISTTAVWRILRENQFNPFSIQQVQCLKPVDHNLREDFCTWFLEQNDIVHWTIFSDESIFYVNGCPSHQHYWSIENQHLYEETHSQHTPGVMVWAALLGDRLIGPYFFTRTVSGKIVPHIFTSFIHLGPSYLEMLETFLKPIVDGFTSADRFQLWFQHDGAPGHYATAVRSYLDELFPGRWIGRGGPREWPPRSPDLNPLDFYLWGYLKSIVYRKGAQTPSELKTMIEEAFHQISSQTLRKVQSACLKRMLLCKQQNGGHFEHLL